MTVSSIALPGGRSLVFTIAAVLLPIGALLAAAVLVDLGQALFGLADLACAPCVSPNDGIDTAAAGVGGLAGGAAAGGAAAGGGSSRAPNPRLPGPEDDVGDATSPYQQSGRAWHDEHFGTGPDPWTQWGVETSEWVEKWAKDLIDPNGLLDRRVAPASKA